MYVQSFLIVYKDNDPRNYNLIDRDKWINDANAYQSEVPTTGQLVCLWADISGQFNFDQVLGLVDQLNQAIPAVKIPNESSVSSSAGISNKVSRNKSSMSGSSSNTNSQISSKSS